jgi:GH15 family glucan-1,4-alpha-glucosidase
MFGWQSRRGQSNPGQGRVATTSVRLQGRGRFYDEAGVIREVVRNHMLLVVAMLAYRYDPSASADGLEGSEGTFSMCSFWYVEALARSGRIEHARYAFEKMLSYANDLGLYAEEIGVTGEQLGNFPQEFSHLALITAAITLDRQLGTSQA